MGCRREYYGLGKTRQRESGEIYITRSVMIHTPHQLGVWVIKPRRKKWVGHPAHGGRGELRTVLWWGNLMETDHLEGPGIELHLHLHIYI